MAELLEMSAQARRILRPMLRALAVQLPWVVDKPPTERGKTRQRRCKPRPEPFRIALPRGVLSAARRDKALEKALTAKRQLVLEMAQMRMR